MWKWNRYDKWYLWFSTWGLMAWVLFILYGLYCIRQALKG